MRAWVCRFTPVALLGVLALASQTAVAEESTPFDFTTTVTASSTNGGYRYEVGDTVAGPTEDGYWYFVEFTWPDSTTTRSGQVKGDGGDITIGCGKCGRKVDRQQQPWDSVKATVFRVDQEGRVTQKEQVGESKEITIAVK